MDLSVLWKVALWVGCGLGCSPDREPVVLFEQGVCNLYSLEGRELVARFAVTETDCKKVGFSGRTVIDFRLDYPSGVLSDKKRLINSDVIFVLVALNDAPIRSRGKLGLGIAYCPPGANSHYVDGRSCFVDGNGVPVVVTEYFAAYGAQKYYNDNRIKYLIGKGVQDFKEVDGAVEAFLDKYFARNEK